MPLSNAYLKTHDKNVHEPRFPMKVYICDNCWLVQLAEYEKAENIFSSDYAYFSSFSTSWLKHCKMYVDTMISKFQLNSNSQVIEVASNDGYLLQYFKERNIPVLGIEPTRNTAMKAIEKGISTEICFFNTQTANKLAEGGHQADLILGNNVVAHVPNLKDFIVGFKTILKPAGVITLEFPHLYQLMKEKQFDTIYHEHFSYLLLKTLSDVFTHSGLEIFDVDELSTHGGSLRVYGQHKGFTARTISKSVADIIEKERSAGLHDLSGYINFSKEVAKIRDSFNQFLASVRAENKVIVGYGAPAKGNTFLNYCRVTSDQIPFTCDRSPEKQGKFLPGSMLPIYSTEKIKETRPDYVLILPWNLTDEISEQMGCIRNWGGKFVTAIPTLHVF